jgi:lysozyme family protein
MSLFELSIPVILRHEGGFVDNPNDPGGATNFGVSLRWLKSKGLLEDLEHLEGDKTQDEIMIIRSMTQPLASDFYRTYWWNAYSYGTIVAQMVATKVFDMSVNLGPPRAHRMVQQVLGVNQDGVLGPKSFQEINAASNLSLITRLQEAQASFYRGLVASNPTRQQFLQGWLNRAYDRN